MLLLAADRVAAHQLGLNCSKQSGNARRSGFGKVCVVEHEIGATSSKSETKIEKGRA